MNRNAKILLLVFYLFLAMGVVRTKVLVTTELRSSVLEQRHQQQIAGEAGAPLQYRLLSFDY